MQYPDIDRYANLDSPIHHIEPRLKIISFGFLIVSNVFAQTINAALIFLAISLLLLFIAHLPVKFILKRVKVICAFVVPIIILTPLTVPGAPIISAGSFYISEEGLFFAILIAIRMIAAVIFVVTMLGTQRFDTFLKALSMLYVPGIIIQMLLFTYRYIYVMIDEFLKIWSSMRAKGYKFNFSRTAFFILGNLIGMLLIKSYERAERVYQAMISKGYIGKPLSFSTFKIQITDYIFCALTAISEIYVNISDVGLL